MNHPDPRPRERDSLADAQPPDAGLLRTNQLKPIYHEEPGVRILKELGRSYLTITKDRTLRLTRTSQLYSSQLIQNFDSSLVHRIPTGWLGGWPHRGTFDF